MRLGYFLIMIMGSSPLIANDPLGRVHAEIEQHEKAADIKKNQKKEEAETAASVEKKTEENPEVKAESVAESAPEKKKNGSKVPLPETFFTNQEAVGVYGTTPHGSQQEVEDYFESYNFTTRRLPGPYDVAPSLQERKRRVSAAIKKQQDKKDIPAPKNPLAKESNGDTVPEKPTARAILNHEPDTTN